MEGSYCPDTTVSAAMCHGTFWHTGQISLVFPDIHTKPRIPTLRRDLLHVQGRIWSLIHVLTGALQSLSVPPVLSASSLSELYGFTILFESIRSTPLGTISFRLAILLYLHIFRSFKRIRLSAEYSQMFSVLLY